MTCAKCGCKTAISLAESENGGRRAFRYNGYFLCQECYLVTLTSCELKVKTLDIQLKQLILFWQSDCCKRSAILYVMRLNIGHLSALIAQQESVFSMKVVYYNTLFLTSKDKELQTALVCPDALYSKYPQVYAQQKRSASNSVHPVCCDIIT